MLSGLNRSLDRLESRRPVSLVLLGARPDGALLARLEAAARVMVLASTNPTREQVRDAVAILLPLHLPSDGKAGTAPLDELSARLGDRITDDHRTLINAADAGVNAVQSALQRYIGRAFGDSPREELL
jgi:hypothetical protein